MGEAEELVARAGEATAGLKRARLAADAGAREAIFAVQKKLVEALAGETMRGLPDLGGRIFGLRLDAEGSAYARLQSGRPTPILEAKGHLVLASVHGKEGFVQAVPTPMVTASLLEPYLRAVTRAIGLHLEGAGSRRRAFERMSDLAGRITSALV